MSSATPSEPVSYAKSRAAGPDGKVQVPEGSPTMGAGGPRRVTSRVGRERPRSARARATVASQQHGLLPYPEYKPSGVERPAEVPEHWDVRRLKYLVSINDDVLPESTDPDFTIQYVDISNVDHSRGIHSFDTTTFGAAPSRARRIVRHGDTIVSTVRTYLRAIAPIRRPAPNMIVSTGFAVLRPRSSLFSSGFAYHALGAPGFIDDVVARSVGANYPAISANQIGSIPIAVPPVSKQHAIAGYLDRETAKIDALISKKETLVERLEEHRTALISRTVTRGLPPAEATKAGIEPHPKLKPSGVEWLGDVPDHWEVRRGKYVFDVVDIRSVTGREELLTVSSTHGVVPRTSPDVSVTMFKAESYVGSKLCWPGDLVINSLWAWGYGLGVSRYHGIVSSAYGVYRLNHCYREYAGYIHWLVRSHAFHKELQVRSKGIWVSRLQLTDESFLNACLPIPPAREQTTIAGYLNDATADIAGAITLAHQEIDLLCEYRTRLISDVVTGKVDVRAITGVDEETAN